MCGGYKTGWLRDGNHPVSKWDKSNGTVCFQSHASDCDVSVQVQIVNCNTFFVYYLPDTPMCNLRYCGGNETYSISTTTMTLSTLTTSKQFIVSSSKASNTTDGPTTEEEISTSTVTTTEKPTTKTRH